MTHAFAKPGRKLSTTRDILDRYETPEYVAEELVKRIAFEGRVLEPAAGTGRLARVLRAAGNVVDTGDITRGRDFLKWNYGAVDNVVTNPPYSWDFPEQFVRKSIAISRRKVVMLLKPGFLWGNGRAPFLDEHNPTDIIILSERIIFIHADGKKIKGQFFDHAWFVWDATRPKGPTQLHYATVPAAVRKAAR